MRITVLAGGTGGAQFLLGVRAWLRTVDPHSELRVVVNNGDDTTLFGLRICPDLDTVMYTLGGGVHTAQRWGRACETWSLREELTAYTAEPRWFELGDRDCATHLIRTELLRSGMSLSQVTDHLCARWLPPRPDDVTVRLLPSTDDQYETHIVIEEPVGIRTVHFQEYLIGLRAQPTALRIVSHHAGPVRPAPGVLEAIHETDVVLLAPSNPVVSIGTILSVPGIRQALCDTTAPVIGISPIIGTAPVRGIAHKVLAAVGVPISASAVAEWFGARVLDGWLVDTSDSAAAHQVSASGIACRPAPLLMTDIAATTEMVRQAISLAAREPFEHHRRHSVLDCLTPAGYAQVCTHQ